MAAMTEPTQLFVYGTLRPGEERWPILARYVVGDGSSAAVRGRLYDTGVGYPAAIFDDDSGDAGADIVGDVVELRSSLVDEALAVLDEVEGAVDGLYRRLVVCTAAGEHVWAYEYGGGMDLALIASGDWLDRSR